MKKIGLSAAIALALVVSMSVTAKACDKHQTAGKTAAVAAAKCTTGEAKTASSEGCGSKAAQTASSKEGCGSHAKTASGEGCGSKAATTASSKEGCGSHAKTASGEGCGSKATTASSKEGCCPKSAQTAAAGNCVDTAMARVMSTLPKMTFKVGDLETPCCHTAKKASEESKTPVVYLVGSESYTCRATAMDKLAELITAELPKVTQVAHVVGDEVLHCPNSAAKLAADKKIEAKVMLAGVEFDDAAKAQVVADKLAAKMKESHGCSKAFAAGGCDKAAKTAGHEGGCDKSAKTAGDKAAGCDSYKAKQAAIAAAGGCDKAKTAGASKGGCDKAAKTASAEGKSGCCADKAKTAGVASEGGCDKAAKAAQTAGAKSGCGADKAGCCPEQAKTAGHTAQTASADEAELTPALANARELVKQIVEFVSTAQAS